MSYHFPGNVRELKHIIKRAVLLTESGNITPDKLMLDIGKPKDEIHLPENFDEESSFDKIIQKVEIDLIKRAINLAGGNKSKAAELLNLNRKTLYRKINNLGMEL